LLIAVLTSSTLKRTTRSVIQQWFQNSALNNNPSKQRLRRCFA
jgi:hypothetical protein